MVLNTSIDTTRRIRIGKEGSREAGGGWGGGLGRGYGGRERWRLHTYRYAVTTCIKMGSDEIHFNVSLIMRDKIT